MLPQNPLPAHYLKPFLKPSNNKWSLKSELQALSGATAAACGAPVTRLSVHTV